MVRDKPGTVRKDHIKGFVVMLRPLVAPCSRTRMPYVQMTGGHLSFWKVMEDF